MLQGQRPLQVFTPSVTLRIAMFRIVFMVVALFVFLGTPLGYADPPITTPSEETYIRVLRTGGFSPFKTVEWSVVVLGKTPLARQRKTMVNYTENMGAMRLLTLSENQSLWKGLEQERLFSLESNTSDETTRREDGGERYRVEMSRGGQSHHFFWDHEPGVSQDAPQSRVIALVQGVVREHTRRIPFRNVFFEPDEVGFLDLDSRPEAQIFVDGRALKTSTPLYTYEMPEGKHTLRLVTEDGEFDRVFHFRIQAGMTTVLNLDLR